MAAKLISVIVPAYNREKYLAKTLDSIFAQDYRPIEVVVVDDGSTDGTASIARLYPEVRYFYQPNLGPAVARNTGLAECTGELISFLDADDYWVEHVLRIQSDYLATRPELGSIMGKVWNFLDAGATLPNWISEDMMTEEGGGWNLGASLTHRWVFERVGHFNTAYQHGEDLDWFARAREAGIPIYLMPTVLLRRRIHKDNLSKDQNLSARERVRILKAHLDRKRSKVAESLLEVRG